MKRHAWLVCVLALIPTAFHAQERQWEATLSVSAQQVLVGEPACLRLTIKNVSNVPLTLPVPISWWHPRYISIRFLERPPLEGREDYNNPVTAIQETMVSYSKRSYAPGEAVVLERSVLNGNPGKCVVQYAYDSRNIPESFNMKTGQAETNNDVWRGLIESNKVSWEVIEPSGVDLEAMQAYRAAIPHSMRGLILDVWKDQLLARFPSSTYAVYALATFYGLKGFTSPLDVEREQTYLQKLLKTGRETLADCTRHIAEGPDGKELKAKNGKPVTITQAEWLRKRIEEAEQICGAHPELPISEQIRYNVIGSYYVELMEFQNAAKVYEKLNDAASDPQIRENSGKMLQLLGESGLVAK